MLTELYSYIHQEPPPPNVATTIEAHKYLEACSLMFEKGFLCHDKICSMDSTVLQNIFQGYKYFTTWISMLLFEGTILVADCTCTNLNDFLSRQRLCSYM